MLKEARSDAENKVVIVSIGTRLAASIEAAREIEAAHKDVSVTVADARWMKPLDTGLIKQLAETHSVMVTVEEGSIGGFGDHVLHFLALSGLLDDGKLKARPMVLPDKYIEAGSQSEQYMPRAHTQCPHLPAVCTPHSRMPLTAAVPLCVCATGMRRRGSQSGSLATRCSNCSASRRCRPRLLRCPSRRSRRREGRARTLAHASCVLPLCF